MLLYITSGSFYLDPESVTNRLSPSKRSYPLRTDWSRTRHREIIHLCDNTVLHFPQPVKSQSAGKVQECVFVDTVGVLGASRGVKTSSSSSCKRPGWETGLWEETVGWWRTKLCLLSTLISQLWVVTPEDTEDRRALRGGFELMQCKTTLNYNRIKGHNCSSALRQEFILQTLVLLQQNLTKFKV